MGVNKYCPENPEQVEVLVIDNAEVRRKQIEKITNVSYQFALLLLDGVWVSIVDLFSLSMQIKANRDTARVEQCLKALTDVAGGAEGNLLALAIEAARARCTVGEITQAMEKVISCRI